MDLIPRKEHDASGPMFAQVDWDHNPYGERFVLDASYNALSSSSVGNPVGHQGLRHDAETGLVYNRARMLSPTLGRFMQRDPLGYVDGMSVYPAYHVMHGGVDPWGLVSGGGYGGDWDHIQTVGGWGHEKCDEMLEAIRRIARRLKDTLDKYDPTSDAMGDHNKGKGRKTKPHGHKQKIKELQDGCVRDSNNTSGTVSSGTMPTGRSCIRLGSRTTKSTTCGYPRSRPSS